MTSLAFYPLPDRHMIDVYRNVSRLAADKRLTLRQAAYDVALARIVQADKNRGHA